MATQQRDIPGSVAPHGSAADQNAAQLASSTQVSGPVGTPAPLAPTPTGPAAPIVQVTSAENEYDLCGQVVAGRYRVLKKMGEGGMGTVYLAEHITIEKKVALKVLLHEYARKQDLKERFLQEAKAAARIGHENIVDITDFGDTPDGSVFFAMEFLEGEDLSVLIRKTGPIPWGRAKPILLQICRGLGAAHSKGIIHRDMKPENIYLIEREGRSDFVKVLDFGIAKMSMEDRESRLTRTGMIFGTPEYMSPEQAQGNKPDHRVDIYAVGVIMYEMITGQVPFKADTFMGILTKHIFEQPLPPSQMNPGVPVEVERMVLKALSKERDERFQSMAEMAAAITQASGRVTRPTGDNGPVAPRIVTPAAGSGLPALELSSETSLPEMAALPKSRGPLLLGILAVVVVGLAALVTFLLLHKGKDPAVATPGTGARPAQVADARPLTRPDAAVLRSITVESAPAGADVFQGDKSLGVTPQVVRLPHSTSKVLLTLKLAGYRDATIDVAPDRDQSKRVVLQKEQKGPDPRTKGKVGAHLPKKGEPKKAEAKVEPKKVEPKVEPRPVHKKKKSDDSTSELKNPFGDD